MSLSKTEMTEAVCQTAGFGLLFALWLASSADAGFFLLLFMLLMTVMRWRWPRFKATVIFDCIACILAASMWEYAPYALALALFSAMYHGVWWAALAGGYLVFDSLLVNQILPAFNPFFPALLTLCALCGWLLRLWERECQQKLELRDETARKLYELEDLQSILGSALMQVEKMTAVAERTRIARDIHDNAGHEIVAAHISLLTARKMLTCEDPETLELYDAALERLSRGMSQIRETAHNLQSATPIGAEDFSAICRGFTFCEIDCKIYGDTARMPMYAWNVLVACLNESLTNIAKHSEAQSVSVTLEAARHIARLCIENDNAKKSPCRMGIGLRNLRWRAVAVGGSLVVDAGEVFRVVCVIPLENG